MNVVMNNIKFVSGLKMLAMRAGGSPINRWKGKFSAIDTASDARTFKGEVLQYPFPTQPSSCA